MFLSYMTENNVLFSNFYLLDDIVLLDKPLYSHSTSVHPVFGVGGGRGTNGKCKTLKCLMRSQDVQVLRCSDVI